MERTLVLLKPDCAQRRLMGRVIARFEDKGLDIVAMKLLTVTPELAKRHYAEHVKKAWYPDPGTIRGDFSASQQLNLVHASDGPESAKREMEIFFPA